jgi:hypothetical protein
LVAVCRPPTSIRDWEAGRSEPLPYRRDKLAALLRISPERLEELLQEGAEVATAEPATARQPAVDLVTAAELRQETLAVEAEYDVASSTGLVARATQHLTRITLLRDAAPNARVRRELWSVEADTATLNFRCWLK